MYVNCPEMAQTVLYRTLCYVCCIWKMDFFGDFYFV